MLVAPLDKPRGTLCAAAPHLRTTGKAYRNELSMLFFMIEESNREGNFPVTKTEKFFGVGSEYEKSKSFHFEKDLKILCKYPDQILNEIEEMRNQYSKIGFLGITEPNELNFTGVSLINKLQNTIDYTFEKLVLKEDPSTGKVLTESYCALRSNKAYYNGKDLSDLATLYAYIKTDPLYFKMHNRLSKLNNLFELLIKASDLIREYIQSKKDFSELKVLETALNELHSSFMDIYFKIFKKHGNFEIDDFLGENYKEKDSNEVKDDSYLPHLCYGIYNDPNFFDPKERLNKKDCENKRSIRMIELIYQDSVFLLYMKTVMILLCNYTRIISDS